MITILSKRLKVLLDERKMSVGELSELADVPYETVRNLYYGKVKDPKLNTIMAVSKALNVTVNYLLGESIFTDEEWELILNFRKCGHHGKDVLLLLAGYEAELAQNERKTDKHRVPCIVPIGEIRDGLPFNSSETVDLYVSDPRAFLAIQINTNNFAPVYCKGDKVLLEKRFPVSGERALFTKDCMVYCRTFIEEPKGYTLKCLNGFGQDFQFKRMNEVKCWGTCIGIVREE